MDAADELQALWTVVFGEPPFIRAEAAVIAEVLVDFLPSAPPYQPREVQTGAASQPAFTSGRRRAKGRRCAS